MRNSQSVDVAVKEAQHIKFLYGSAALMRFVRRVQYRISSELDTPSARLELLLGICALLLGLFSATTIVIAGQLSYTGLPFFDEWDIWNVRLSGKGFWSVLGTAHNEHRIPVPRLLYMGLETWFAGDTRPLLWLTALGQLSSVAVLYTLACSTQSSVARRLIMLGLTLSLLFSAPQWLNFLATLQVCFVLVYSTAIAALGAFAIALRCWSERPLASRIWIGVSVVCAMVSTGTEANGLLVWPMLVLAGVWLRAPRIVIALFSVCGIIFITLFISHYEPLAPSTLHGMLSKTPNMLVYAMAYLGSWIDEPLMTLVSAMGLDWKSYRVAIGACTGAAGLIAFVYMVFSTITHPEKATTGRVTLLAIAGFMVGSAALTGFGRVQFPMETALHTRYTTTALLFWACLMLIGLNTHHGSEGVRIVFPRLEFVLLCGAFIVGGVFQLSKIAYSTDAAAYLREAAYAIVNDVHVPQLWQRSFHASGLMIPVVNHFRAKRLGIFSADWPHQLGEPLPSHYSLASPDRCHGFWESATSAGNTFHPGAVATGWAFDPVTRSAPRLMVFADGRQRIIGFTAPTRPREDVYKQFHLSSTNKLGWAAYLPVTAATQATAYSILEDGRSVCSIGTMMLPATYVTAPIEKAGPVVPATAAQSNEAWSGSLPAGVVAPAAVASLVTWGSHDLKSGVGVLRLRSLKISGGMTIGLPVFTSAAASGIELSIVDEHTSETLARAAPSNMNTWHMWKFEFPVGAPSTTVSYVITDSGRGSSDWAIVGQPRAILP